MTTVQIHSADVLPRRKSWRRLLLAGSCAAVVLAMTYGVLALVLADSLLTVRDPIAKADVIVVLGGDGPSRAAKAARLWLSGAAPQVLVSGDGDCYWIRRAMEDEGVSPDAVAVECDSGTTWENALFSSPYLKHMNARRAILVTSWYHSRRAKDSFIATSPNIDWISVPLEPRGSLLDIARGPDGTQILKEYPKIVWYAARLYLGAESTRLPTPFASREARA